MNLLHDSSHTNLSPTISQSFITVCNHFPIFTHLHIIPIARPPFKITFRRTKNINIVEFNNDRSSDRILHLRTSLPELLTE